MPVVFDTAAVDPVYGTITAADVELIVKSALSAHQSVIDSVVGIATPTFATTILRKEQADARLGAAIAAISHLASVRDTPQYRDAFFAVQPTISAYFAALGQNLELLATYVKVRDGGGNLSAEEQRAIELALRDFQLSGVALDDGPRVRFVEIATSLSELQTEFANAVMDATDGWSRPLAEGELAGIPDSGRTILAGNAIARGAEGWMATLDEPSVQAVMTFAEDRALRAEIYHAHVTRASDVGPQAGRFDNGPRMTEILRLRREAATLLGFEDAVAFSLATKMAGDGTEVRAFLAGLLASVRPVAEQELAALRAFAAKHLQIEMLEPWDMAFARERMRRAMHAIDEDAIAQYFPVDTVLVGLFDHIRSLFGVDLAEQPCANGWHPDVRRLVLRRDGAAVADLYLDLHARPGKRSGAWMADGRHRVRGVEARPIAFLTCNFAPRVGDDPVLLRHDDVVTLFHEMGHCLHHLLTEIDLPSIGGISGVEWDAVELPSQFHEVFAWDAGVLAAISGHVETGEPLPQELIARMIGARDFQSAMGLMRQLELSLFDIEVHALADPAIAQVDEVAKACQQRCALLAVPEWHRFSRSFGHIFAGGYAAGYYSYLWAERISADAYEAFLEPDADRHSLGRAFRKEVLARGASRPTLDSFIAFRGRAPDDRALLRQRGLAQ